MSILDQALSVPILGQLTYTWADDAEGVGWQARQVQGLADDVVQAAVGLAPASLSAVQPIPDYPSPDLPVRLLYAALPDYQLDCVWHSVPAGRDGAGRPGVVFSQGAVLDAGGARVPWLSGSPDFNRPFGQAQIADTRLAAIEQLACGEGWRSLGDFLFDRSGFRLGTLAIILDAVACAFTEESTAVLLLNDCDEAANWVSAVSACTDAETARRIHFSTWERASNAADWDALGLQLVCLPREDAELLRSDFPVIDTASFPSLGEWPDEPHRIVGGAEVPATPWSQLLLCAVEDAADFWTMVEHLDEVRSGHEGVAWGCATALALCDLSPDSTAAREAVLSHETDTTRGES
jgi:hypothetical protein